MLRSRLLCLAWQDLWGTWVMNSRSRFMESPRNWLCLMSSYRLTDSSSNTRHRCACGDSGGG